jgi:adhesin/invasin
MKTVRLCSQNLGRSFGFVRSLGALRGVSFVLGVALAAGCGKAPAPEAPEKLAAVKSPFIIQSGANTLVAGLGGPRGFGALDLLATDAAGDNEGELIAGALPVQQAAGSTDDGFWQVDITSIFPNGINYFGIRYTSMFVGTNGYITFGTGSASYTPQGIQFSKIPIIAAQYDDLYFDRGDSESSPVGSLYLSFDATVADPVVTLTWYDVMPCCGVSDQRNRFQIRLHNLGGGAPASGDGFAAELRYNTLQFANNQVAGFADGTSTGGNGNPEFGTIPTTRYGLLTAACITNFLNNATNNPACTNQTPPLPGVYVWTSRSPGGLSASAGSAQSAAVGSHFATALTTLVTDLSNVPLPNATVTFVCPTSGASCTLASDATIGTATTLTAVTNGSGLASVFATANATVGAYTATASVTGVVGNASFALTNTVITAASITAAGGAGQTAAIGTPFATPLTFVVRDASSAVLPNVTVNFSVPAGGATAILGVASATTDVHGLATVTATAGATVGSYALTATVAGTGLTASSALTNVVGGPASISISGGASQSATVGSPFGAPLSVVVRDGSNNPLSEVAVTFTIPVGGASAALSAASASTDNNGAAFVTATAGGLAGGYTVVATVEGTGLSTSFALTNTAGAPANLIIISGNGQAATVGAAFASPLVVSVSDALGNNVSGAAVFFAPPGSGASATPNVNTRITGADGLASVTVSANIIAGGYGLQVSVEETLLVATFALTNTAGLPASISALAGGGQSAAVGTAFTAPLTVVVHDASGNPIIGATVTFTAPPGGASATLSAPSAVTDGTGLASLTATAGVITGSYSVTATVAGTSTSTTLGLTNLAGPAISIVVDGDAETQQTVVGTPFPLPLGVHVRDAQGNDVPGATVSFFAPTGAGPKALLSAASAVTGADGVTSVTALAGTVAGTYTATASLGDVVSTTFALTNRPGAPAAITVGNGSSPQAAQVSTAPAHALAATVTDTYGNAVPAVLVDFSAPASGASAALSAPSAITTSLGLVSVTAVMNTTPGTFDAVAVIDGTGLSAAFVLTSIPGAPATIRASGGAAQSVTVGTAAALPLSVIVSDVFGNPVPDALVAYDAPVSGPSSVLGAFTASTDATGSASIIATATTLTGSYVVSASVTGGAAPATFNLTNVADVPASITASPTAATQSAQVATAYTNPLTVSVLDRYGNPVPGATVSYALPGSGPTVILTAASAPTAADGSASVAATAGTVTGSLTIAASVPGVPVPAAFALTNLPGAPNTLAVDAGAGQSAVVAVPFAAPLVAQLKDAFGNPVPGATVTFVAAGAGASASFDSPTALTGADGRASVNATAGMVAGLYAVIATSSGASAPAQFPLTNLPGLPASILAAATSTPQSAQVATGFANPLGVMVTDSYGNPVPLAAVVFSAPATGPGAMLSAATVSTDAAGQAQIEATASSAAGSYQISAAVSGAAAPALFALTNTSGVASSITASAGSGQSAAVGTAFAGPLVAWVRDPFGNPVAAVTVTFLAPASGPSALLAAATAVTDATGKASLGAQAGSHSGTYAVTASADGSAAPASFALTNTQGTPGAITVVSGGGQSAMATAPFAAPLKVLVSDSFGNPVSGASVTFTAPASGASAALAAASATTGSDGTAQVTATANGQLGAYVVLAGVTGAAAPASIALTNIAIGTSVQLTASAASVASHQLVTFTVTVSSPLGVPTGAVQLTVDGKSVASATLGAGSAQTSYRASALGVHAVIATYDAQASFGAAASAPLQLTVTGDAGTVGGGGGCAIAPGGSARGAGGGWPLALLTGGWALLLVRRRRRAGRAG